MTSTKAVHNLCFKRLGVDTVVRFWGYKKEVRFLSRSNGHKKEGRTNITIGYLKEENKQKGEKDLGNMKEIDKYQWEKQLHNIRKRH